MQGSVRIFQSCGREPRICICMEVQESKTFRLSLEAEMKRAAETPLAGGRATLPMVSYPNLKQMMIYMPPSSRWNEHSTTGRVSVLVLRGKIRVSALDRQYDLAPGELLAMDSNVKHDVEALEESWYLLTVARCD